MSRDLWELGVELGRHYANTSRREIISALDSIDLGHLAGWSLESAQRTLLKEGNHIAKTRSWTEGFFDGFMERAEELRK